MRQKQKDKLKRNSGKLNLVSGFNLARGTYKDLKRQAIILGMPFPEATGAGIFDLINFIYRTDNVPNKELINQYDDWMDQQLAESGYGPNDPLRSSRLRLGFLGEENKETGERRAKRIKGITKDKKKKKPREKDEQGHVKGTKKSYTWECAYKGFDLERTKRRVLKKFPDANEKSIQLWYRAAKRKQKSMES